MNKRDWQADMRLCNQLNEWYEHEWQAGQEELSTIISIYEIVPDEPCNFVADCENDLTAGFIVESREALPYWLQQYAELEKEHAYAKKQAIMWNDKAVAEKARADQAEAREQKLREALEKITRLGWSDSFGGGYEYSGEHHAEALSIAGTVLASLYPKEEETK